MKIIYLTAMHGRHKTVDFCLKNSPELNRLFVYSTEEDRKFLMDRGIHHIYKENLPLSFKWNEGIKALRYIDFDAVCILGSDDYVSESFDSFIKSELQSCKTEFIGFTDMYFVQNKRKYYWGGYTTERKGEPIGAGRVFTKSLLERLDYNLFDKKKNKGLDGMAWNRIKEIGFVGFITTMKEHGIEVVDVKDGQGMTSLTRMTNLNRIE